MPGKLASIGILLIGITVNSARDYCTKHYPPFPPLPPHFLMPPHLHPPPTTSNSPPPPHLHRTSTSLPSTLSCCIQELQRFNKLTDCIRSSLIDITKAVKGIILMSSALEDLGNALYYGKRPELWMAAPSYPSLKPLAGYVQDYLYNIQCSEIFTLRNEKLHTEI